MNSSPELSPEPQQPVPQDFLRGSDILPHNTSKLRPLPLNLEQTLLPAEKPLIDSGKDMDWIG